MALGYYPNQFAGVNHEAESDVRCGGVDGGPGRCLIVGRTWKGTAFGGVKGRTELPGYVDRYMNGQIELDSMVTHTMPLEDINRAFDLMHSGESIRSVIIY